VNFDFRTFLTLYGLLIVSLVIFLGAGLFVQRNVKVGFRLVGLLLGLVVLYTRRYDDWHLPAPASTNVGRIVIRLAALGLLFFFFLNEDD
jgi:hypothetical protein